MDNKTNLITNSLITLGLEESEGKGKGRYFQSKFIEAGIAHYDELGDILITKETLDKFIQTMVGCPVIINHKDVTDKNADKLRVGVVSKVWFNDLDGWYYCEGILTDNQAIDLVKNQGWSVSCSYNFVSDNQKKMYHGKEIDMEFIDGEFLHLAIVEDPRYENANIVVNSIFDIQKPDKELTKKVEEVIKSSEGKFILKNLSEDTQKFINDLRNNYGTPKSLKGIVKIDYKNSDKFGGEYIPTNIGALIVLPKNYEENKKDISHEFAHAIYQELNDDIKQYIGTVFGNYKTLLNLDDRSWYEQDIFKGMNVANVQRNQEEFFCDAFAQATIDNGVNSFVDNFIGDLNLKGNWVTIKGKRVFIEGKKTINKFINNNIEKENLIMSAMNDLKEFILNVVNNACKNEVEEEKEEEKKETVETEKEVEEKKPAENKCKNEVEDKKEEKIDNEEEMKEEDKIEDKEVVKNEKDEEDDEEIEEEVKNKKVKNSISDMKRTVIGSGSSVKEESFYTSQAERLELGNKY